jgi:hypothetical protein
MIAYVGAALVEAGEVPADLRVEIPDLEAALLGLLDGDAYAPPGALARSTCPVSSPDLIGV